MAEQEYTETAAADYAEPGGLVTVANESALLVPANDSRSQIIISSDAPCWISYGTDITEAQLYQGVYVPGYFPMVESDWKGPIYVIEPNGGVHVSWNETSYNVGDDEGEESVGAEEFVPSGPSDGHPWTDQPAYEVFGE